MTDESKVDTSQLVGSSPADRQSEPHVDPAVKLDPAKNPPPPEKPVKPKRAPAKKRAAAKSNASAAQTAKAKTEKAMTKVASERRNAARDEGRAAYEAAKLNQVETFAQVPEKVDDFQLRFAADKEFLEGAMDVTRAQLSSAGMGRITCDLEVDFSVEGAPALVNEAWLIAASGEAVCCDLGVGLRTGGGQHAKIPAKHLLF